MLLPLLSIFSTGGREKMNAFPIVVVVVVIVGMSGCMAVGGGDDV